MKTLNRLLAITIFLINFTVINVIAKDLSGKIYGIDAENKKAPLKSATVNWLGTSIGTFTDEDGKFTLPRSEKTNKLIISYTGYLKDTINVPPGRDFIDVTLKASLVLDEVQVTSQQGNLQLYNANIKTEEITLSGLRKAACCNLAESFQTNPSVDVEYSDALTGAKQIMLLGLQGTYSQLMTEQIPNLRGIASTYGLAYIPGSWMESIQISKGTASVRTGYESITGQINVEYKKPQRSEPLFLNLYSNQLGRVEGNMNTRYELSDELSTMLLAHGSTLKSQFDFNKDGFLDVPMGAQINAMNRWNYETDNFHSQFGFKAMYEDRQAGQKNYYPKRNSGLYGIDIQTERYEFFAKNGYIFPTENYNSLALLASVNTHRQSSMFGINKYNGKQKSAYLNLVFESRIEPNHEHESTEEHSEEVGGHTEMKDNNNMQMEENHSEHSQHEEGASLELSHIFAMGLSYQFDEYDEIFKAQPLMRKESVPGIFGEYTLSGLYDFTLIGGLRADFHNLYGTFVTPRVHLRYQLNPTTTIRASAGKGYHIANIFADNSGVMASSRQFIIEEKLKPEEAWNYGLNLSTNFSLFGEIFTLNAEYYRTNFNNQIIVNLDRDPSAAYFYNLKGDSYSNSFQVDLSFSPLERLEIMTAYRINDVKMTIDGKLETKPLLNTHKAFLNLAYSTSEDSWQFDFTVDYNGGGRLPNTSANPAEYRLKNNFPAYAMLMGQITKNFDGWSIYLGGENLTDYKQPNPIIGANDPFGQYFDSSIVWAPILGRVIYLGVRFEYY